MNGGHTVLLVEDDSGIASFITRALWAKGYRAEWTTSGQEALDRIGADGVAMLILDLNLPDMDGVEVLRELRGRGHALPVIIVTARTDPEGRETAQNLGVTGYLRKPFPLAELLDSVQRVLRSPTAMRPD